MKTFLEFTNSLRAEIWPEGEAKTLKDAHTAHFRAAMINLQTYVPKCLAVANATVYASCNRYWEDAKSVMEAPNGVIQRVFTIANDDWRDRVFYTPSNLWEMERWAKRLWQAVTPANLGLPPLKQGYKYEEKAANSTIGRARVGIWMINRRKLFLAPWLQTNEKVVVEWDGPNHEWNDTDGVNTNWWTKDVQEAIKLYVLWQHHHYFGDRVEAKLSQQAYNEKLADLMHWCNEKTRQQEKNEVPESTSLLTSEAIQDDEVPSETSEYATVFIADWGLQGAALSENAATINGLNPRAIFFGGDNIYSPPETDPKVLFDLFTAEKKWPMFGNYDWDHDADLSSQLALFELPNNERFYEVVDGPVHFFLLSSDPREPDGGYVDATTSTQGSIMGGWLQAKLALSTAKWKIVMVHHAPYTADVTHTPGAQWMRWPFQTWGADAVISGNGHVFEHMTVGGFPYFVAGIGGRSLRNFGATPAGATVVRQHNSDYGFLKIKATCTTFKVVLTLKDGTEEYEATLTKE